jgi:hypothetical protein
VYTIVISWTLNVSDGSRRVTMVTDANVYVLVIRVVAHYFSPHLIGFRR